MRLHVEVVENKKTLFSGTFERFPVTFGRADHCHIVLPDARSVSRVHGVIVFNGSSFYVTDLESKSGLFSMNGERFLQAKFATEGAFKLTSSITVKLRPEFTSKKEESSVRTQINASESSSQGGMVAYAPLPKLENWPQKESSAPAPAPIAGVVDDNVSFTENLFSEVPVAPHDRLASISEFLRLEVLPNFKTLPTDKVVLQGVLTWGDEIVDVRQFRAGDLIWVGGDIDAPVYLPGTTKPIVLGWAGHKKGSLQVTDQIDWRLNRDGINFDAESAAAAKFFRVGKGNKTVLDIQAGDLFTCSLPNNTALHLRHVESERFFIRRTWIENREEFVKAFKMSAVIHAAVAVLLFLNTPATHSPKIENVPERFAKLLVQPPKTPFAAKPTPTPAPKLVAKPEPPQKKVVPKKPISVAKKKAPSPRKIVTKTAPSKPVAVTKPTVVPPPPKISEAVLAENSLLEALSANPGPPQANANKAIKITQNSGAPAGIAGLSTAGISGALKAKGGKLQGGAGVADGTSGTKVGQFGYAKAAGGSKTGTRGVAGSVVGTPDLGDFEGTVNGLTEKEVMSVVNKHLSAIQRCYERSLLNDPALSGRVQYEWDISPAGGVTKVRVKRSELTNGDSLNGCVIQLFKAMKFPAAKNKQPTTANVGFPFGKEN